MRWSNVWGGRARRIVLAIALAALVQAGASLVRPGSWASPQDSPPRLLLPAPPSSEFLVMIDPGHGGQDHGTVLGARLLEKEVTLVLARELRRNLEERGVPSRLLRDADVDLSLDQRAEVSNQERAALFIALHACPQGRGARVYMPMLPGGPATPSGPLLWESAQAMSVGKSNLVARALIHELTRAGVPATALTAPLRPLNNVLAPAVAVEWQAGRLSARPGENQRVLETLASAIASAIVKVRGQLARS